MRRRLCRLAGAVGLTLALAPSPALAQSVPCEFDTVERIVAIGDVHGAYETFVDNLKATGIVDDALHWTGGSTHLVQTGDVLDRGPDSRKAMDLLMKLESEASTAGGRVHALIGNHEFWNAVGALDYVSREELEAFGGETELLRAFSAAGTYGQWIRRNNAVVRVGDLLFVHGGITPAATALGLCAINDRVRADMDRDDWPYGFAMSDDGPLMTRRYSGEDLTVDETRERGAEIKEVLETLGARTMVMGHTVTFGLIEPRFDGAAMLIDAGMFEAYLGGHQAALVVESGRFYAVYPEGKIAVPASLDGDEGSRYIEAAVAAAPEEMALKRRLAELRTRQGKYREAAELYEEVGALDPRARLPYHWRKEAAEAFTAIAEKDKANELNELYLQGMRITAERAGEGGIPLLNAYARESLRLGLGIDDAFDAARKATAAYPENMSFKVTLAWAWLARGDARRAARVGALAIRQGEDSFLAHYVLGQAHVALGNTDQAVTAFRAAEKREPDNENVKEALANLQAENR